MQYETLDANIQRKIFSFLKKKLPFSFRCAYILNEQKNFFTSFKLLLQPCAKEKDFRLFKRTCLI